MVTPLGMDCNILRKQKSQRKRVGKFNYLNTIIFPKWFFFRYVFKKKLIMICLIHLVKINLYFTWNIFHCHAKQNKWYIKTQVVWNYIFSLKIAWQKKNVMKSLLLNSMCHSFIFKKKIILILIDVLWNPWKIFELKQFLCLWILISCIYIFLKMFHQILIIALKG